MNKKFSQQWLEIVCSMLPDVKSAIFMMPDKKSKQLRPLAKWPENPGTISDYAAVVKYALKKREQVCFPKGEACTDRLKACLRGTPSPGVFSGPGRRHG